ncbi:MAG: hypothetical protein ABI596_16360, partial [Pyrinomonadaceae bacterium]
MRETSIYPTSPFAWTAHHRQNHVPGKYFSSVTACGLRVSKETTYINNADTITIGTTGMNVGAVTQKFARYPIALVPLKDGLAVFAAPPDHPEMVGWALESIDGTPVEEVIKRVSTLYASENQATRLG